MSAHIEDKVIVITGASSGLGATPSRAAASAISQPDDVDVSEIVLQPTRQTL